ncbi:hypothetical protein P152DRAFT_400903 [Eremomyces bilateralis CBS 781.70]|uniref:RING-14 protein n=1 Tax=Eremomyces bilateralis CBS 781.70 TaxID=1392243 RepID=A0A6G1FXS6_9PEZI|nr:uncharacterized protein P152DRAFT_400903 [Eremomyces bilateralis CBS 781.70]KAF1810593.1 hypothetical protein P152DRAFT_400903 [Eremomyces bilateralis CBS 781.70]
MKFAHTYHQLLNEEFPSTWIDSAISYKRLKKCIKRIQRELASIGLDVVKLRLLLNSQPSASDAVENSAESAAQPGIWKYTLDGCDSDSPDSGVEPKKFVPRLLFAVDEVTGEPLDARLDPVTKRQLHKLALAQSLTSVQLFADERPDDPSDLRRNSSSSSSQSSISPDSRVNSMASAFSEGHTYRMVSIPITSDSEFFRTLQHQLTNIAALQKSEKGRLTSAITDLGAVIEKVAKPTWHGRSTHDLRRWRKIFQLYLDSRIFVSTGEKDHGAHNYEQAQKSWGRFLEQLRKSNLEKDFAVRESHKALERFLEINFELLRSLRFQDLNGLAMAKILKKFSKRTALSPRPVPLLPLSLTSPLLTHSLSRSIVFVLSTSLLSLIPQLDDHLCPICAGIAYLPIRLPCTHVFCIRCVVMLQRRNERNCPLCRKPVVMKTSPENLDWDHAAWLRKWFRKEAMQKHRENERASAAETMTPVYSDGCSVM